MILFDNKLSLYYNKDRSQTLDKHSTIFYYSLPAAVEDVAMLNHLYRGRGRRDVRWLRRKPDIVNVRRGRRRCSFDWGRRGRDYGSCRGGAGRLLSLLLIWLGLQIILVLWRIPVGGDLDIVLRLKWEKLMVLKWTFRQDSTRVFVDAPVRNPSPVYWTQ